MSLKLSPATGRARTRPLKPPTSKTPVSKGKTKLNSPVITSLPKKQRSAEPQAGTSQESEILYNVQVNNSFDSLTIDEDDEPSVSNSAQMNQNKINKPKRIPPIIIHRHLDNPSMFFKKINNITSSNVDIKCTREKTIFLCSSEQDHKTVNTFLEKSNVPFHTYPLPGEALTKLVLKGLSNGTAVEDIYNELAQKNFPPTKIVQLKQKETNSYIPLYICMFPAGTPVQEIYKINRLCYTCITWAKYRNNSTFIQCFRCLGFNHTSRTCRGAERCIQCGRGHENSRCNAAEPKCANCHGPHWANSKECPAVKRAIEQREKLVKSKIQSSAPLPVPGAIPPPTSNHQHYPKLGTSTPKPNSAPPTWPRPPPATESLGIGNLLHELMDFLKNTDIINTIKKIFSLLQTVNKAQGADKWQIILDGIISIFK